MKTSNLLGSLALIVLMFISFSFKSSTEIINENTVATATAAPNLTGIYEGTTGSRSLYYVTQEGTSVYFFVETYDGTWAAAFEGSIKGSQLFGKWYNLTKGSAQSKGDVSFTVSNDGRTWTRDGETGGYVHKAVKKTTLPAKIPATRKAAFSGNSINDITGYYQADNAMHIHLRDVDNKIIFFAESKREAGNNNRPGMACVFFGTKSKGSFSGKWVDLPLGHTSNTGKAKYSIIGPKLFKFYSGYFPGVTYNKK